MDDKIEHQRQSSLPPPSKAPRLSPDHDTAGLVTMAAPPPLSSSSLGLGLELGISGGTVQVCSARSERSGFTFLQLQELEHQALIFKYMIAGVPVPLHLVLPIWKSVASATYPTSAYTQYPSFMGYGSLCFGYRNSLEPEPGRCRRTDGKKWRCSRDVVPDQKYCERHMHRGRSRSRKPVEPTAGAIATTAAAYNTTTAAASSPISIAVPNAALQLVPGRTSTYSTARNSSVSPPRLGFSSTIGSSSSTACKTGPS